MTSEEKERLLKSYRDDIDNAVLDFDRDFEQAFNPRAESQDSIRDRIILAVLKYEQARVLYAAESVGPYEQIR